MIRRKLSPVQRQTAKFLAASRAETVEVTIFSEVDVTEMIALRRMLREDGSACTVTHFILVALARALAQHPEFNAHFQNNELTYHDRADIGVAVSLDNGDLVTPVLRDVGAMTLEEIAQAARDLASKAQAGALKLADMKGAGFTVSSVGQMSAPRFATPVVPVPQVAILAAMAIREVPVVRAGNIVVAPVLPLSLSFDHRAINGAAANAFLQTISDELGAPKGLLSPSPLHERTPV